MIQEKEENLLKNRLTELARTAENRGIPIYTDFLNLNEQTILYAMEKQLKYVSIHSFGGYALAERRIFCLEGNDYCYNYQEDDSGKDLEYPLQVIQIKAKNEKFSDKLTHRDYLGAILNLGIDRGKVGDIIAEFTSAYVFCKDEISQYIVSNLSKVKHTQVECSVIPKQAFHIEPKFEEIRKSVSSLRLDAVIAAGLNGSRSSLSNLIKGEKVYVNGKRILSNSYSLKEGDVISVRGFGKFRLKEIQSQTRKGRTYVLLQKYI